MNKCALLKYRGHPGLNQGPVDLQSNALTELYHFEQGTSRSSRMLYH